MADDKAIIGLLKARLGKSTELLQWLLDDELVDDRYRTEVAVQIEFNRDAFHTTARRPSDAGSTPAAPTKPTEEGEK